MSTKFRYSRGDRPSPILTLKVISPIHGRGADVRFFVDTGAEMSVVPGVLIAELGTKASDEVTISDYDNRSEDYSVHAVHLKLGRRLFRNVVVVPSASGAAFLGLDILNQLKLTLDGPKKQLIIH